MKINLDYLHDKDFLNHLYSRRVKEHYARVVLLDYKTENFYKDYVGRVTAGSVTLSATSAIRRTCSLTVVADEKENDLTNIDGDIAINKKFQLFIGYKNDISGYEKYGSIIWFPLGLYIFTGVSISRTNNGNIITITGKDKMCLLNGEIQGEIFANTSFHEKIEYDESGEIIVTNPTIFQIIQESVNHLGGESLNNIIINNLPTEIKQAIQYNGDQTLYYGKDENDVLILTLNKDIIPKNNILATYEKNSIIGYKLVPFTFPGELVMAPGSNICNLLQTIINKLGNYEFFYDKEGIFFFQEIKNYLNITYSPLIKVGNEDYTTNFAESTDTVYNFNESESVLSYTNVPNSTNIKNDFWIWGINQLNQPICYHLVIDDKPEIKSHDVIFYKENSNSDKYLVKPYIKGVTIVDEENEKHDIVIPSDWRYELYLDALENSVLGLENNAYAAELIANFPSLFDFDKNEFYDEILENPAAANYWLDFVSSDSIMGKFSVNNIGRRIKAVSSDDINVLYNREIPDIVILNKEDDSNTDLVASYEYSKKKINLDMDGQNYVEVDSDLYSKLSVATIENSAYEKARELLLQYTNFNETITLTALPLYFLEPNNRISVINKASGINGDYIIQTLNLPLAASGQMTLTASRATNKM